MNRSRAWLAGTLLCLTLAGAAAAQDRSERTAAYLRSFHDLGRFNGTALVIDRGRVLFEGAFGMADFERENPATAETRYRIASLTKQFTAALILRLEEEGLLAVDAPVARYIDEYPRPQGDRITLHHLLTHTSGLPSYTNIPGFTEERIAQPLGPAEIVGLTWAEPLAFEPGSRYAYSNSGYVLLGWIAERVTGKPYARLVEEMVLAPAGLEDTGYDAWVEPPRGHARGYRRTLTGYEPARELDPSLPHAAGMLYSTVGDLRRWMSALLGWGEAPSPFEDSATVQRMLRPELDGYGYGLGIEERPIGHDSAVRVVEHTGGIFGFSSLVRAFPDHERLIVLLDNTSSALGPIASGLTNLLWGAEAVPPKPSIAERILPIVESAGVEPALERYRDWRRVRPEQYAYDPSELVRLARHFFERGDAATAAEILEAQVAEEPDLVLSRHALSEIHAELGDTARAVAHVEAALTYLPGAPRLLERLRALGSEIDPALAMPVVPVEPAALERLVGDYTIDPTTSLTVELGEEGLTARRTGEPAFRLLPLSPTSFLLRGSRIRLDFALAEGRATSVAVTEGGRRVTFPRAPRPR